MTGRESVMSLLYVLVIMKKLLTLFACSGKIITTLSSPRLYNEEEKQLMAESNTSEVHIYV